MKNPISKKVVKKKVVKKKSNVVLKKNSPLLINKKKSLTLKRSDSDASSKKLFIVGIGASAGGLEAMQELFDNMPFDSGLAFVVIQHLDPTHKVCCRNCWVDIRQ